MRVRRAPRLAGLAVFMLLALAAGCSRPQPATMRQDMRLGTFTLRATSVDVYSRAHQGVPLEVEVLFRLTGGNRFDRSDFAETVSRRGGLVFRTGQGWQDRAWMFGRDDAFQTLVLHANPPAGSHGYTLEIGNPYGEPRRYLLDLGR